MKTIAVTYFILLLHSCRGHDEGTYGEYLQTQCDSKNHDFAVSIDLLPVETDVQMSCGGSLISMSWSLSVAKCIKKLFKERVERSIRDGRRKKNRETSIFVKGGFKFYQDEDGSTYIKQKVRRTVVDKRKSRRKRRREAYILSLVNHDPFEEQPNLHPAVIPEDPEEEQQKCPILETVSIVTHKKTEEIPTTTSTTTTLAPETSSLAPETTTTVRRKRPKGSNFSTEYVVDRICRSVSVVQKAGCVCELVTRPPTTTKRTTLAPTTPTPAKPCLICGEMKVPGQSKDSKIIEAEEEPPSEYEKPVANMSSCVAAIGSPLACNGKLVGIENECHRGGARADTAEATFTGIASYLDFIVETVGDASLKIDRKKKEKKETDKKEGTTEATSGEDILKGDIWKMNLVVATGIFFFIHF